MLFRTQSQKSKKNIYIIICSSLYFVYSGISDLALEILKILIPLCFCDALQPVCQHKYTRQAPPPLPPFNKGGPKKYKKTFQLDKGKQRGFLCLTGGAVDAGAIFTGELYPVYLP